MDLDTGLYAPLFTTLMLIKGRIRTDRTWHKCCHSSYKNKVKGRVRLTLGLQLLINNLVILFIKLRTHLGY